MNSFELDLLRDKTKLIFMNNYLKTYQFNEIFLIASRKYYDGKICIMTQKNLSFLFTIEYLYNSIYDKSTSRVYFDDIVCYFKHKYTKNILIKKYNILFDYNII